jgi:3'-phosphoadenosine 5'-phosphosulfate sulfotransferase (PAPS reductase)/FAD synthetase
MNTNKYGWNGWKMPIFNLNDPDYCEYGCPVCTRARQGNPIAQFFLTIERVVTFGGCWWGRARQRKYGVKPNEPIPEKTAESM